MVGLSENTAVCKSFIVLEERQGEEFLDSATGHAPCAFPGSARAVLVKILILSCCHQYASVAGLLWKLVRKKSFS
jgi:hypothetical protein